MPIVVRNTFTPNDHRRTCIMNLDPRDYKNLEAPLVSGITLDRDVARIEVSHFPAESSLISKIFRTISEASVNVDIIVHNRPESADTQMSLGFTTTRSDLEAAIAAVKRACPGAHVHTQQNLAKVSVVGVGMSSHPGVASATFAALTSSNIEINMISTSEIKISCVIDAAKADEACRVLHREFIDSVQIPNA
jgi:aspartate kinase